jgi:hypothetical protein
MTDETDSDANAAQHPYVKAQADSDLKVEADLDPKAGRESRGRRGRKREDRSGRRRVRRGRKAGRSQWRTDADRGRGGL